MMSNVVALMSMSLHGYVADGRDGVAEVAGVGVTHLRYPVQTS